MTKVLPIGASVSGDRQQARKAKTRGKILDAARTLFAQIGYNPTTIDEITQQAGVGRGTFYMHFTGKADLLHEMNTQFRNGLYPILESLGSYTAIDESQVCVWINRYIDFLGSQNQSMRALWTAAHVGGGASIERDHWHELALNAFGTRIPAFQIAAERRNLAVTARAQLLLFQLEGFASACALDNWNADREATIIELAKTFLTFISQTDAAEIGNGLLSADAGHHALVHRSRT